MILDDIFNCSCVLNVLCNFQHENVTASLATECMSESVWLVLSQGVEKVTICGVSWSWGLCEVECMYAGVMGGSSVYTVEQ
jgi:hypothetical protein